jgi:predicted AlkP superfamily phosphohydrolase/phosphomutase
MVVLGIDGLDPSLLQGLMQEGALPSFSRLAQSGGWMPLGTSIPPQSPVAWSDFITGMDPGGHGIFDFIALDRSSLLPYLSTSRVERSTRAPLRIGRLRIPLGSERVVLLREGTAFWELLEAAGVPTRIVSMPANYPPVETPGLALSGMGTPDMRGTPGTFSFYTDDPAFEPGPVSGGEIYRARVREGVVHASLEGPPNGFVEDSPPATAEFTVRVDPEHPVAEITLGDSRVLLNQGEWSAWLPVEFELLPWLASSRGMVRFYLKEAHPRFRLYASPVNLDPERPAQPISTPADYAPALANEAGRFYTQEMPEDTKALSAGVLTSQEFLGQTELVLDERRRLLASELERFLHEQHKGLFFFYVSSVDQRSHMLYREMDELHPFHAPDTPLELREAVRHTYLQMDALLATVLERIDPDTLLVVMSDHGFAPFRRQANLNRWLEVEGYLALRDPARRAQAEWLEGIDWSRTRAFAIGLNSLYLNVRGRERHGILAPAERDALAREIAAKLLEWRDGPGGPPVVTQAALREDVYRGPHVAEAPDLLVGYAPGYRASWGTTSGRIPEPLLEDNDREWSGDHCMDSRAVPGVLLVNRPLALREGGLRDLTVSILRHFDVEPAPVMRGRALF